jgi:hypothetical protein
VDRIRPGSLRKERDRFAPGVRQRPGVKIRYWVSPMLARHGSLSARLREQQVCLFLHAHRSSPMRLLAVVLFAPPWKKASGSAGLTSSCWSYAEEVRASATLQHYPLQAKKACTRELPFLKRSAQT